MAFPAASSPAYVPPSHFDERDPGAPSALLNVIRPPARDQTDDLYPFYQLFNVTLSKLNRWVCRSTSSLTGQSGFDNQHTGFRVRARTNLHQASLKTGPSDKVSRLHPLSMGFPAIRGRSPRICPRCGCRTIPEHGPSPWNQPFRCTHIQI